MGTHQTRKEKIDWLNALLREFWKKNPKAPANFGMLEGMFCMHFLCEPRVFREIIRIFEKTELIKIKKELIYRDGLLFK